MRKYTLYAIGEITLVVIGILIALQINNWNEWRKDRALENQILHDLTDNINVNIQSFENFINGGKRADQVSDYVMAVLDGEISYSSKLDSVINLAVYRRNKIGYSSVAYETLKNTNIGLIQNTELKKEIIRLFEEVYPDMIEGFKWDGDKAGLEYMDHHFLPIATSNGMIWRPYDFRVQMKDNYFKSMISKIKIQRTYYKVQVKESLLASKRVLQLIKEELSE